MAVVNRMLNRIPETADDLLTSEMTVFIDNMDVNAWYYLIVQEATNSHISVPKDGANPAIRYEKWTGILVIPDKTAYSYPRTNQYVRSPD